MDRNLKFLTIDDQALIVEFSRRIVYAPETLVLRQGDDSGGAVYTIWSGVARVEVNGVCIAHLGPGSLIGEMSFVENVPASASVIAHTELGVDAIDAEHMNTLLASVPGFATRFYKSLSALFSERLRTTSQLAADPSVRLQAAGSQIRLPDSLSAAECPAAILQSIDCLCAEMRKLAVQTRNAAAACRELGAGVSSACDRLLDLLVSGIKNHPDQAAAIGKHVFREAFPYLMTSRINEHAYTRLHGHDGDGALLGVIRADRESGHGAFGAAVDRWVLDRPIMRALRARGAWIMESLSEFIAGWEGNASLPVTCLMTGTSEDLLEIRNCDRSLDVTCLEMDSQALQDVAKRWACEGGDVRISFVHTNLLAIGRGIGETLIHSQKVVIVPDLLNRYTDECAAVHLLDWIYERLRNDGAVVMGQIRPDHPDRAYLENILGWHFCYRDQHDLERLFAASKFRADALTFEHHPDGVQTKVICHSYH